MWRADDRCGRVGDSIEIAARLSAAHPASYRSDRGYALAASPLRREFTRQFESTLVMLGSTAGFVLLIVCGDDITPAIVEAIRTGAHTGLRGDGVITVCEALEVVRIRSGERNDAAV